MGDNRARRLLRTVERAAYLAAVAPAVGRLPAALSYRMACWRGDWRFRCQTGKRTEIARNLGSPAMEPVCQPPGRFRT